MPVNRYRPGLYAVTYDRFIVHIFNIFRPELLKLCTALFAVLHNTLAMCDVDQNKGS